MNQDVDKINNLIRVAMQKLESDLSQNQSQTDTAYSQTMQPRKKKGFEKLLPYGAGLAGLIALLSKNKGVDRTMGGLAGLMLGYPAGADNKYKSEQDRALSLQLGRLGTQRKNRIGEFNTLTGGASKLSSILLNTEAERRRLNKDKFDQNMKFKSLNELSNYHRGILEEKRKSRENKNVGTTDDSKLRDWLNKKIATEGMKDFAYRSYGKDYSPNEIMDSLRNIGGNALGINQPVWQQAGYPSQENFLQTMLGPQAPQTGQEIPKWQQLGYSDEQTFLNDLEAELQRRGVR